MPDARCTRSRVCVKKSTRVSNHRYTASAGIPCAMVLTVSFVLSPVTGYRMHTSLLRRVRAADSLLRVMILARGIDGA